MLQLGGVSVVDTIWQFVESLLGMLPRWGVSNFGVTDVMVAAFMVFVAVWFFHEYGREFYYERWGSDKPGNYDASISGTVRGMARGFSMLSVHIRGFVGALLVIFSVRYFAYGGLALLNFEPAIWADIAFIGVLIGTEYGLIPAVVVALAAGLGALFVRSAIRGFRS